MPNGTRVRILRGGYAGYSARATGRMRSNGWVEVKIDDLGGYRSFPVDWLEIV